MNNRLASRVSGICSRILFSYRIDSFSQFSTVVKKTRKLKDPITLTENAANRIKELIAGKEDVDGIRIGVKKRGCNGISYTMNYAKRGDPVLSKDDVVNSHGVTIFIDPKAVLVIVGTEMDFVETPIASEFVYNNPNSKGSCGCGESFNV